MVENMLDIGQRESSMVEEYLQQEHKENKVNGKMAIEKDGLYLNQMLIQIKLRRK